MITYLQRRQINKESWNDVISNSPHETIYPYSWYLDACALNWGGFIMNDYECIMPVAFKKVAGLKYTYQPLYCQQLGVYSKQRVDSEISRMFLHALKKQFNMGDYAFNAGNILGEEKGFEITDNVNYVLQLSDQYEEIETNYNEYCKRNIKKAVSHGLEFSKNFKIKDLIALKRSFDTADRNEEEYVHMEDFFSDLNRQGKIQVVGARKEGELLAGAIFAYSEQRIVYLFSASSQKGKEYKAMFMILDKIIQLHCGEIRKFDFEGSNISSIANFFRGFGAKPDIYQRIRFQNSISKLAKRIKGG